MGAGGIKFEGYCNSSNPPTSWAYESYNGSFTFATEQEVIKNPNSLYTSQFEFSFSWIEIFFSVNTCSTLNIFGFEAKLFPNQT